MTLKLEGNFTYTQRKPFQGMLKAVSVEGIEHIVIDLSQVAFLDSAGIRAPDDFHRQVQGRKRTLSLAYPQPTVRQIIELANLHKTNSTARFGRPLRWPKECLSLFRWHGRSRACRLLSDDVRNAVILDLVGELTIHANRATFKSAVDRVKQPGVATILNMHAVRFLDSSALRDPGAVAQSLSGTPGMIDR